MTLALRSRVLLRLPAILNRRKDREIILFKKGFSTIERFLSMKQYCSQHLQIPFKTLKSWKSSRNQVETKSLSNLTLSIYKPKPDYNQTYTKSIPNQWRSVTRLISHHQRTVHQTRLQQNIDITKSKQKFYQKKNYPETNQKFGWTRHKKESLPRYHIGAGHLEKNLLTMFAKNPFSRPILWP